MEASKKRGRAPANDGGGIGAGGKKKNRKVRVLHNEWTASEDAHLLSACEEEGKKWSVIARGMEGRTENAVKNRWALLEKRMAKEEKEGGVKK